MRQPPINLIRRHRIAALATVALVLGACSGDDADENVIGVAPAGAVEVEQLGRFGDGFAREAFALGDGRLAAVTGVGVFDVGGPDDDVREIDAFDRLGRSTLSAVSSDRSTLAIVNNEAGSLRWYDLDAGERRAAIAIDPANPLREAHFVSGSTTLVAASLSGITVWDLPAGTSQLIQVSATTGPMATLENAAVAPLLGTNELVVVSIPSTSQSAVTVPGDGTVLQVQTSPSLDRLAVRAGVGPNQFDRVDTITILEADGFAPVVAVPTERPLADGDWAVIDDAVAWADDAALVVWPFDGSTPGTVTALPDDRIQQVVGVEAGFVTVHQSGAATLWPRSTWQPEPLGAAGLPITTVDAQGTVLTAVDADGGVTTWDIAGATTAYDQFASGEATSVAFDGSGERLAVATTGGRAYVLDDELSVDDVVEVDHASTHIDTIDFHPVTDGLVTGRAERRSSLAFDDSVELWNDDLTAPVATIGGEAEDVPGCSFYFNRIEFTPDGELMTTISHDFTISVHGAASGSYLNTLGVFDGTILDTAMSFGGDLVAASSDSGTVAVWDLVDFEEVMRFRSTSGGLQAIELLPDDATLVAADLTGRLVAIDIDSGEETSVIADLGQQTKALAVSADGRMIAAPIADGSVGLWSPATGRIGTIEGLTSTVSDLAFSPDGDRLAVAGRDGAVRVWRITENA